MALQHSQELLQQFWNLASVDSDERIAASKKLLELISEAQNNNNEEEQTLSGELQYSFKRLVRGLSSSREGARQGFAVALTEMLRIFDSLPTTEFLKMLKESTMVQKGMKSWEKRNLVYGKIVGLAVLVRSERVKVLSEKDLAVIVTELLDLSSHKSYLAQICFDVLTDLCLSVSRTILENVVIKRLSNVFPEHLAEISPGLLNLLIKLQQKYDNTHENLQVFWKYGLILDNTNFEYLIEPLRNSSDAHPKVHSVWYTIVDALLDKHSSVSAPDEVAQPRKKQKMQHTDTFDVNTLHNFWETAVDNGLFNSTLERKYLGFQVTKMIVRQLPPQMISLVLQKSFMRTFIHHLSESSNTLNNMARSLLKTILMVAGKDSLAAAAVAAQLVGKHGARYFDKITKTHTVRDLLSCVDENGANAYLQFLKNEFYDTDTQVDGDVDDSDQFGVAAESRQIWALDSLHALAKSTAVPRSDSFIESIAKFFAFYAFFDPDSPALKKNSVKKLLSGVISTTSQPSCNTSVVGVCRERFYSVMAELSSLRRGTLLSHEKQEDSSNVADSDVNDSTVGVNSEGKLWGVVICEWVSLLLKNGMVLSTPLQENESKIFEKALKVVLKSFSQHKNVHAMELSRHRALDALIVFLCLLVLDEDESVTLALEELLDLQSKLRSITGPQLKKEEVDQTEIFTDALLALLSRPSAPMRIILSRVFKSFAPVMSRGAFSLLLSACSGNETEMVQEDVPMEDAEESENEEDGDDDGDSSEEDGPSDSDSSDTGSAVAIKSNESFVEKNLDDVSESEMEKFDEVLVNLVGGAKKEKKEQRDARRQSEHFRVRVLDMIEIVCTFKFHGEDSNLLPIFVWDALPVLLDVAGSVSHFTEAQTVVNRASNVLSSVSHVRIRGVPNDLLDASSVAPALEKFVQTCLKTSNKKIITLSSDCLLFARRLYGAEIENDLMTSYRKIIESRALGHDSSCLPIIRLKEQQPHLAWKLAKDLVRAAVTARRKFVQREMFETLGQIAHVKLPEENSTVIKEYVPEIQTQTSIFLTNAMTGDAIDSNLLRSCLKSIQVVLRTVKSLSLLKTWDVEKWKDSVTHLLQHTRFSNSQALRALCENTLRLLTGKSLAENGVILPSHQRKKGEEKQSRKRKRKGAASENGETVQSMHPMKKHKTEEEKSERRKAVEAKRQAKKAKRLEKKKELKRQAAIERKKEKKGKKGKKSKT